MEIEFNGYFFPFKTLLYYYFIFYFKILLNNGVLGFWGFGVLVFCGYLGI